MGSTFTSNCSNKQKQDRQNIISTTIVITLDCIQVSDQKYVLYIIYNNNTYFRYITHTYVYT